VNNNLIGYNGKLAYIDLTNQTVSVKDLDNTIAKEYLGGSGLSAKITYDLLAEKDYTILKDNPFSEINPLIMATGPVTGTIRPSSGRYSELVYPLLLGFGVRGHQEGSFVFHYGRVVMMRL